MLAPFGNPRILSRLKRWSYRVVKLTVTRRRVSLLFEALDMVRTNPKKTKSAAYGSRPGQRSYRDVDHAYFRKNFSRLVREHGGEWIVLAKGNLIGIGKKNKLNDLILRARSKYPDGIPFIAPIPTKEEIECVL